MKNKTLLILVLLAVLVILLSGCRMPCDTDVMRCLWV